ncbi:MAG: endonuclease/exonuclease/phosphatase family protein [Verrucomicrobiota bacterium JB025]|nr:endonuclease/exonuclease/phosphatase family protein [Verrucomicrobiota bacterium JB025]
MSNLRRSLGWTLVVLSLALHLFTVYCFARQPDRLAAFTVLPIWFWGGIGLFFTCAAFYFLRAPLSLVMTAVWAVTLLVGADEARILANFGKEAPEPGAARAHNGRKVIRVITMNCALFHYGDPSTDIAKWQPDIVLLQECHPHQTRRIADALYGGNGDYRPHQTNGIVSRWRISREVRNPLQRDQQVTIAMPPRGIALEVVNVHLPTAATNLRFWKRSAWREHRHNRATRHQELWTTRQILQKTGNFPNVPTIFGGDFNAPATDIVHRQLDPDFLDVFATAGTGWGNTYQRRAPILRIDHLYVTPHLIPVRCRVVKSRHSDHRMVVADLVLK